MRKTFICSATFAFFSLLAGTQRPAAAQMSNEMRVERVAEFTATCSKIHTIETCERAADYAGVKFGDAFFEQFHVEENPHRVLELIVQAVSGSDDLSASSIEDQD